MKRILFLTQGDRHVASSRHRVYQYLAALELAGFEAIVHPGVILKEFHQAFLERSWQGNLRRAFRVFTRRVRDLHQLRDFDYIFVQKPILPAPFFNMELKIAREAKLIFDFDDAIFLKKPGGSFFANLWAQSQRVTTICRRAHRVVVANSALAEFVRKAGVEPIVLPTPVDTEAFAAGSNLVKRAHKIPVIGWIGNPTTQTDLNQVVPSLIDLHSKTPFVVRIIGGSATTLPVRFPIEWQSWNLETEISDVAHIDYGLAPLADNEWNRHKSGLKVLQYWAAGVPVVASPVGIYREMIQDRENGLFASGRDEWAEKLILLMKNPDLCRRVVTGGHKTVQEKYSLKTLTPQFLKIFDDPTEPTKS